MSRAQNSTRRPRQLGLEFTARVAPSARARALLRRLRLQGAIEAVLWTVPAWLLLRLAGPLVVQALSSVPLGASLWPLDALALLGALVLGLWRWRQRSSEWLAARLNARRREFEDSAGLLFRAGTTALAGLQRARIEARLTRIGPAELGIAALRRGQLLPPLFALLLMLAAGLLLRPFGEALPPSPGADVASARLGPPQLQAVEVSLQPPAYTGLARSTQSSLDVQALQGSQLQWALSIQPAPQQAALLFIDGERLPLGLQADGRWQASMALQSSRRYRLEFDGQLQAAELPAAKLEASPDLPPQIRVRRPGQTLNILGSAAPLTLEVEVSDDFGLGAAELVLTLAAGDGEQVEVSEQRLALRGEGDARSRRYSRRLDLAALGLIESSDLILRVEQLDNRPPRGQRARSASYILRWPRMRAADGEGVEGFVQRTLPAYFRSQRQVIIDSEALIEQRPALAAEPFMGRSDAIGVDQRLLRLRYGEFLGEAVENDGPLLPEGHSLDDGHGHVDPASFGDADAIRDAFGHTHDYSEATTLFDPVTRERLRAALREMWQSELHLRLGDPVAALPYQYRALDLIKQIQQASRIYLARVGLELPPIEFSRRLTGERKGALRPRDPLRAAERADAPARAVLSALRAGLMAAGDTPPAEFDAWLARQPEPSALDLRERLDRLQREPDCGRCRLALQAALWQALDRPPQGPALRPQVDSRGRAWLEALEAKP